MSYEKRDNFIGRGGSLADFAYYNECDGLAIIDIRKERIDDAEALWDQAPTMCAAHAIKDPEREARVQTHMLVQEIRGRRGSSTRQPRVNKQ